jgi:transposase
MSESTITEIVSNNLEKLINSHLTPQCIAQRAKIILKKNNGEGVLQISRTVDASKKTVSKWIKRYEQAKGKIFTLVQEKVSEKEIAEKIQGILKDKYRPGCPGKFTPEQLTQIIALACEDPSTFNLPISNWTNRELAEEIVNQKIAPEISPRHVGRILNEVDLHPHKTRYWLNANPKDQEAYDAQVRSVCKVYQKATSLYLENTHVVSIDEMTGIQALERKYPTKPTKPGLIERREFEYIRHGTQCLIGNFHVATGKIISPTVGDRRTEEDFVAHLRRTIETDPDAGWIFVADNLNTHVSEGAVKLVAKYCGITDDLGLKGKSGVLKSMETRTQFLQNSTHKIHFVFTPKHSSWLNQIEIWFSILVRRLLKRASFGSEENLKERILAFIDYFNKTMAKPFKWTYAGRPLTV